MSATDTRMTHRTTCRLCGSAHVERVVDLDPIPLSEHYSADPAAAAGLPRFPIDVYMCGACGHVQQLDVIDPQYLWSSYTYYSGDAKGMPEHFAEVADKVSREIDLGHGRLVVDIGSNDGSLLKPFKRAGCAVLGIDPAADAARRADAAGIPTLQDYMSPALAVRIRAEHGPATVVCAFNVFAHADDLGAMVDCVRTMLAPDGLFFFEAQYLQDIIDGVLVATLFHEHLSHHSVAPLTAFFDRHGLELIAVERARIQHGSLIGTAQVKGGPRPVEASVRELLASEKERRLEEIGTLRAFGDRVAQLRARASSLVAGWRNEGKALAGYGAARSGPTLITQFGLKAKLDFIVDDHPQKVGRYESGDGIAVLPTTELIERMPDYTIILAWVHSDVIIRNNREYLERGGHFVVLCPSTRVVGKDGDVQI